jgi:hypothetical protein
MLILWERRREEKERMSEWESKTKKEDDDVLVTPEF